MGVDCKLVCLTKEKDIFKICEAVEDSVKNLISLYKDLDVRLDPNNVLKNISISPSIELIDFHFFLNGENRSLKLFFGCNNDHDDEGLVGPKLILSLGMWGLCDEIMLAVGESLKKFGPTHIKYNDCDGSPWEKIPDNFVISS